MIYICHTSIRLCIINTLRLRFRNRLQYSKASAVKRMIQTAKEKEKLADIFIFVQFIHRCDSDYPPDTQAFARQFTRSNLLATSSGH